MADTQETITDIIAEKRRRADEIERDCAEKMKRGEMVSDCYARELVADIRREADRLEAAYKCEKAAIEADALSAGGLVEAMRQKKATAEKSSVAGDCAKLREACAKAAESAAEIMERVRHKDGLAFNTANYIAGVARAALAAPPRNCDIYLTEEAVDAATVTVRGCEACSRIDMEAPCVFCMVRWLLAPAKEGGAK